MFSEPSYEKLLQQCLKSELRIVNTGLPRQQKSLYDLLQDKAPHTYYSDGTKYTFKKSELLYLANLLTIDDQKLLLLPIIIQIGEIESEATILCQTDTTKKVVEKLLEADVVVINRKIIVHYSQLAKLRENTKTITQYMFSSLHTDTTIHS